MAGIDVSHFALFVRPTGKGKATRYGDKYPMGYKGRDEDGKLIIDTDTPVAIPHAEFARCRRGYLRQIAEGALERLKAQDFIAFHERRIKDRDKAKSEAGNVKTSETGRNEDGSAPQRSRRGRKSKES